MSDESLEVETVSDWAWQKAGEVGWSRVATALALDALRARLAAVEQERDRVKELYQLSEEDRGKWIQRCNATEDERDAALDEVEVLRQALQFYADENRYDYDAPCCPTPNNPGHKIADGDVISDDGERAREALYGPVAAKERP